MTYFEFMGGVDELLKPAAKFWLCLVAGTAFSSIIIFSSWAVGRWIKRKLTINI